MMYRVNYLLCLILLMGLSEVSDAMGYVGNYTIPEKYQCMAVSSALSNSTLSPSLPSSPSSPFNVANTNSSVLLVLPGNLVLVVKTNIYDYSLDGDSFVEASFYLNWPYGMTDYVSGCTFRHGLLYMVGLNGLVAFSDLSGNVVYTLFSSLPPLLGVVAPMDPPNSLSSAYCYAWSNTNPTVYRLSASSKAEVNISFTPAGASADHEECVYFYSKEYVAKLSSDMSIQARTSLSNVVGIIPEGGVQGYFFHYNTSCIEGIFVDVFDLTTFSTDYTTKLTGDFCAVIDGYSAHVDDNHIYFFITSRGLIYKISRTTLQIEDILSSAEIYKIGIDVSGMTMAGVTADGPLGMKVNPNTLHKFSSQTCNYNSFFSNSACHLCPLNTHPYGTYSAAYCVSCQAGYYSSEPGVCSICPAGSRARVTGSTTDCVPCQLGRYSNGTSVVYDCLPCPLGKFGNTPGFCADCPTGKYADAENSTECKKCPNGMYSSKTGSVSCLPCRAGTFTNQSVDMSYCTECPLRYHAPNASASECLPCPAGSYSDKVGTVDCPLCKNGLVSKSSSSECEACKLGTHRISESDCAPCEAGTHRSTDAEIDCTPCEVNFYSREGQKECFKCTKGEFSLDRITCSTCKQDIWNASGACTPIAQISIGVVASVVLVGVSGSACFWWWRKRRRSHKPVKSDEYDDEDDDSDSDENLEEFEIE